MLFKQVIFFYINNVEDNYEYKNRSRFKRDVIKLLDLQNHKFIPYQDSYGDDFGRENEIKFSYKQSCLYYHEDSVLLPHFLLSCCKLRAGLDLGNLYAELKFTSRVKQNERKIFQLLATPFIETISLKNVLNYCNNEVNFTGKDVVGAYLDYVNERLEIFGFLQEFMMKGISLYILDKHVFDEEPKIVCTNPATTKYVYLVEKYFLKDTCNNKDLVDFVNQAAKIFYNQYFHFTLSVKTKYDYISIGNDL